MDGVLRARVAAPAVGGAANSALVRLLAHELGVAPTTVRMVAGASGRQKLLMVDGVAADDVLWVWPGLRL